MSKHIETKNDFNVDSQKDKYLVFTLEMEDYAIEIKYVTEIIGGVQQITRIPELPDYVKGIINLRGKIIPVVDMRLRFRKEAREYDERTCIIVVEIRDVPVGLVVDRVSEVIAISSSAIADPPKLSKGSNNKYIKGIAKVNSDVKLLLDCEELVCLDEMADLAKESALKG